MENNESILETIRKLYNSKGSVGQKIQGLINTRRSYHGNIEVQNECNRYLDKLYNLKYEDKKEYKDTTNEAFKKRNALKDMYKFNKKRQKGLGAFVKLDAGNVEVGNNMFNQAMGNSDEVGVAEALETEEPKEINIRKELNEIDKEEYTDFVNMYEAILLNDEEKKTLVQLIVDKDIKEIDKFLSSHLNINEELTEETTEEFLTPDTCLRNAVELLDPQEFQLDLVRDDISLQQLYDSMKEGKDVYEVASVNGEGFDSDVRELLFSAISDALNIPYKTIWNVWLGKEDVKQDDEE